MCSLCIKDICMIYPYMYIIWYIYIYDYIYVFYVWIYLYVYIIHTYYVYTCMYHKLWRFCLGRITDRYWQAMTGMHRDAHTNMESPLGNGFAWSLIPALLYQWIDDQTPCATVFQFLFFGHQEASRFSTECVCPAGTVRPCRQTSAPNSLRDRAAR